MKRTWTLRWLVPVLTSLILAGCQLAGCQYDPHAHLDSTSEPKTEDVVGTYVLDYFDLPLETGSARPAVVVELRADGTFTATNVPPRMQHAPDVERRARYLGRLPAHARRSI
jgi:hypothetical protein